MTKPTGRPRGRPRKENITVLPKRMRGRPALPLLEDPNRYAVAAALAISDKYKLNLRKSSVMGGPVISDHQQARNDSAKSSSALDWSRTKKNRNLGKTDRWLRETAKLIFIALNYENIEPSQHITRVLKISEIWKEKRFARKTLLPLIGRLMTEQSKK
jgi:hypothetical protein